MEGLHVVMLDAIDQNLFKGISVGLDANAVSLSHCFFADDALFLGEWGDDNVRNLICILNVSFCSKNGFFSVSLFRTLIDQRLVGIRPTIWCKYIPPTINFFLWRASLNRLPDKCNLADRGMVVDNLFCSSCSLLIEDFPHIFFDCTIATQGWAYISTWLQLDLPNWRHFDDMRNWIYSTQQNTNVAAIFEVVCYATMWALWRLRKRVYLRSEYF
ncbi:uncharacterized protein [Rutidosis leptorrhynchoides]|uniref:uncharacterized protein n=1 Tax=Rutidosis leptorrhynchoides TaxID=125765 RepID=UPI003A9928D6